MELDRGCGRRGGGFGVGLRGEGYGLTEEGEEGKGGGFRGRYMGQGAVAGDEIAETAGGFAYSLESIDEILI